MRFSLFAFLIVLLLAVTLAQARTLNGKKDHDGEAGEAVMKYKKAPKVKEVKVPKVKVPKVKVVKVKKVKYADEAGEAAPKVHKMKVKKVKQIDGEATMKVKHSKKGGAVMGETAPMPAPIVPAPTMAPAPAATVAAAPAATVAATPAATMAAAPAPTVAATPAPVTVASVVSNPSQLIPFRP